jgi:hypothetical protein
MRSIDSRFRNAPPQFLLNPDLSAITAYLRGFRRFWYFRFPTQFGSVLAWLQYGCSTLLRTDAMVGQDRIEKSSGKMEKVAWCELMG